MEKRGDGDGEGEEFGDVTSGPLRIEVLEATGVEEGIPVGKVDGLIIVLGAGEVEFREGTT